MKKIFLAITMFCLISNLHAGGQEDLMRRTGFSQQEIAAAKKHHEVIARQLQTTGPKSDPKVAAKALKEARLTIRMRELQSEKWKATQATNHAYERATQAEVAAEEADRKAEVAVQETRKMGWNQGISAQAFYEALDAADASRKKAEAARENFNAAQRHAAKMSEKATNIVSKASSEQEKIKDQMLQDAGLNH